MENDTECGYNQNEGYVIFSAMGSFFIPMAVMVYVYARISCVVAARHEHMTEIEVHKVKLRAVVWHVHNSNQTNNIPFSSTAETQ